MPALRVRVLHQNIFLNVYNFGTRGPTKVRRIIQIPGHSTSTILNFLQYIRPCHVQIPGQMQTPKVFLLLSCILHQYRTSAKALSVQDPPQGKVQRIDSAEGCKSNKTLLFCQILKGGYIWQILFQCVLDKDPCILPYHCDLQAFCVLT